MKEILHIYTRVSTTIQETDGTSLKTQKETGIDLSKKLGMSYQIHNEGGSSSSKDTLDNRPILLNILKMMDDGVIKNLYVWNTDRLSRNQITWYTIRQVMVKNGVVLYTSNGKHETTDFMENMILGILSEVSQYDNQVRMERSRLGKIEKVKLNYWRGGDCTFGYKLNWDGKGNKLVEFEEESKWVRFIFTEYSKGTSLKVVKRNMEENGIKTRRGNEKWSMGSLQVILRNETYLGYDQFVDKKTKLTIRNTVPQLISNKLWEECQRRRKLLLMRKNQINRTSKFYLFRDFLICKCGTPLGGRIKTLKGIQHYYCPLQERKFNNSYKEGIKCDMKRCLNIPSTDTFLWNKIIDILSDTIELKKNIKERTLIGKKFKSKDLKHEIQLREEQINELTKTKGDLEKGLVEVETNKFTHKYPSEEIYNSLRKELTKQYNHTKLLIEEIKNTIRQLGTQESWFEWIDNFGDYIGRQREVPDTLKKTVLKSVLDHITIDYDHQEKVHLLYIQFRIPVFYGVNEKENGKSDKYLISRSLKTLVNPNDQPSSVENYSTVTDLARLRG